MKRAGMMMHQLSERIFVGPIFFCLGRGEMCFFFFVGLVENVYLFCGFSSSSSSSSSSSKFRFVVLVFSFFVGLVMDVVGWSGVFFVLDGGFW